MNQTSTSGFRVGCAALAVIASNAPVRAQSVEWISRTPAGPPSTGQCYGPPVVSADGRYVAFNSDASDFGPTSNALGDVFVLDRVTNALVLASPNMGGLGTTVDARVGGVSADGRYVAFFGDGLRPADLGSDYGRDILVWDRVLATLTDLTGPDFEPPIYQVPKMSDDGDRIAYHVLNTWFGSYSTGILIKNRSGTLIGGRGGNASIGGDPGDTWVEHPFLSADGRYLVYQFRDVAGTHVRRWGFQLPGQPEEVVASSTAAAGSVDAAGVSRDGRYVLYTRLVGATHAAWIRDMETGLEEQVDPTQGSMLSTPSVVGGVSDDGRFVAYSSASSDFVTGDTNNVSDIFVRDRLHQRTARISVDALGAQSNGASTDCAIDPTGAAVVFLSAASNLVPGDVNGKPDVFRRSMCALSFPDADGDSFGGGSALFSCATPPAGHVAIGGDCDDADPARHPGAQESCNGVDDDCDALVDEDVAGVAYCFGDGSGTACPCGNSGAAGNGCASSVNANGARLGTLGCASLSADTLVLAGSGMTESFALYFQGDTQQSGGAGAVFGDGLRCVSGTVVRLGSRLNLGGSSEYPGSGDPSISLRGGVTAPGVREYQCWYRNATSFCTSATFNLTNGLSATWTP